MNSQDPVYRNIAAFSGESRGRRSVAMCGRGTLGTYTSKAKIQMAIAFLP